MQLPVDLRKANHKLIRKISGMSSVVDDAAGARERHRAGVIFQFMIDLYGLYYLYAEGWGSYRMAVLCGICNGHVTAGGLHDFSDSEDQEYGQDFRIHVPSLGNDKDFGCSAVCLLCSLFFD